MVTSQKPEILEANVDIDMTEYGASTLSQGSRPRMAVTGSHEFPLP
jgi:hypothetical protein